jgi:hypothetical protein
MNLWNEKWYPNNRALKYEHKWHILAGNRDDSVIGRQNQSTCVICAREDEKNKRRRREAASRLLFTSRRLMFGAKPMGWNSMRLGKLVELSEFVNCAKFHI